MSATPQASAPPAGDGEPGPPGGLARGTGPLAQSFPQRLARTHSDPAIVVVLVEPAGPLNVGSVARLCANFAIAQLRLVAPRCNPLGEEARRMAVHGQAQLDQAATYPDLASAIADCRRVVATSGRLEREELPLEGPGSALGWLIEPEEGPGLAIGPGGSPSPGESPSLGDGPNPAAAQAPVALVFGREDRGLSNDELLQAGKILRLESSADYASLNLSHAVAICLHELRRIPAAVAPPGAGPVTAGSLETSPGSSATSLRGALEASLADAQDLLLDVGFLHPHTAHARMAKLRGLLQRAQIREGEVALIRGMVRQLRWATTPRTP